MRSDELNIVQEQIVEKRNIIPIDQFFDEMYLTESGITTLSNDTQ